MRSSQFSCRADQTTPGAPTPEVRSPDRGARGAHLNIGERRDWVNGLRFPNEAIKNCGSSKWDLMKF